MPDIQINPDVRHDFVLLFDVQDGNPNGDPDAGNLPRTDPETMQGLVSDVAIKRKVRNYVDLVKGTEARFKIYVQSTEALNTLHQRAYDETGLKSTGTKQKRSDVAAVRDLMCRNFYDIRTFGAVMSTNPNAGQVRGPVQLTFARSINPIVPLDLSITRIAVTRPEDMDVVVTEDNEAQERGGGKVTEMGRKAIVPYGLYMGYGFYSPHFAKQTGFDRDDLVLLWEALERTWDLDHSASRGMMSCRGLYIFSHDNATGRAPAHELFKRIQPKKDSDVVAPRRFEDYAIAVDESGLPDGVALTRLCG